MEFEAAGHRKPSTALATAVWLLTRVHALVDGEVASLAEGFATQVTAVWPFPRVDPVVRFEVAHAVKPLPTLTTAIWLFPGMNTDVDP